MNTAPGTASVEHLPLHLVEIDWWRGNVEQARARLERSSGLKTHESVDYAASYRFHEALLLRAEGSARGAGGPRQGARCSLGARHECPHCEARIRRGARVRFRARRRRQLDPLLQIVEGFRPCERQPLVDAHAARFRAKLAGEAASAEKDFRRAGDIFRERELVFCSRSQNSNTGRERSDEAQPLLLSARETSSSSSEAVAGARRRSPNCHLDEAPA
jgi:hypothetical protein